MTYTATRIRRTGWRFRLPAGWCLKRGLCSKRSKRVPFVSLAKWSRPMLLSSSFGATAFYEPHFPLYEAVCCLRDLRRVRFPFSHVPPSLSPSPSVRLHFGARIFARHCCFYRCNRKWDGRTNGRTGTNTDQTLSVAIANRQTLNRDYGRPHH